ncbi:hypothetical protein [Escherichia coli ISC41]|nr:hypothetical protein [Escherichia coli ISC41]
MNIKNCCFNAGYCQRYFCSMGHSSGYASQPGTHYSGETVCDSGQYR